MQNKYRHIQELIGLWTEYEANHTQVSFADFGNWLAGTVDKTPKAEFCDSSLEENKEHLFFYKEMPAERQFLTLLSRAARFLDFYIRKAFEELEINSRLEFQFLISIKEMGIPRKTDIINFNLVEISTGVETIKRLSKKQLIEDVSDTKDKRVKRLKLTTKGEATVKNALERFDKLDNLVSTFQSEENWRSFIPLLMSFNDYHTEIYHKQKSKPFDYLIKLFNKTVKI